MVLNLRSGNLDHDTNAEWKSTQWCGRSSSPDNIDIDQLKPPSYHLNPIMGAPKPKSTEPQTSLRVTLNAKAFDVKKQNNNSCNMQFHGCKSKIHKLGPRRDRLSASM